MPLDLALVDEWAELRARALTAGLSGPEFKRHRRLSMQLGADHSLASLYSAWRGRVRKRAAAHSKAAGSFRARIDAGEDLTAEELSELEVHLSEAQPPNLPDWQELDTAETRAAETSSDLAEARSGFFRGLGWGVGGLVLSLVLAAGAGLAARLRAEDAAEPDPELNPGLVR